MDTIHLQVPKSSWSLWCLFSQKQTRHHHLPRCFQPSIFRCKFAVSFRARVVYGISWFHVVFEPTKQSSWKVRLGVQTRQRSHLISGSKGGTFRARPEGTGSGLVQSWLNWKPKSRASYVVRKTYLCSIQLSENQQWRICPKCQRCTRQWDVFFSPVLQGWGRYVRCAKRLPTGSYCDAAAHIVSFWRECLSPTELCLADRLQKKII